MENNPLYKKGLKGWTPPPLWSFLLAISQEQWPTFNRFYETTTQDSDFIGQQSIVEKPCNSPLKGQEDPRNQISQKSNSPMLTFLIGSGVYYFNSHLCVSFLINDIMSLIFNKIHTLNSGFYLKFGHKQNIYYYTPNSNKS